MSREAAIEGKFLADCDLHCATCTCRILSVSLIEWLFRFQLVCLVVKLFCGDSSHAKQFIIHK